MIIPAPAEPFGLTLRLQTHNHHVTAAARQIAAMKLVASLSYRVAMRRQSLRRQNMRSMALRPL